MKNETNNIDGKKRRRRKLILAVVLVIVIILGGLYFVFEHFVSKLNFVQISTSEISLRQPEPTEGANSEEAVAADELLKKNIESETGWDLSSKNVTNILLIGVDNDYTPGMDRLGNADGLIIVSINEDTKQVVLTSIMRDVYVCIPDEYNTKITLTYHFGGTETLIKAIETNFGIPIDNYVLVNYIDVVQIVDAVGGLELELSEEEIYYMEEKIRNVNYLMGYPEDDNMLSTEQAGLLKLNGVQTAAYMRIRMAGNNDFERTERARRVLLGLKDEALSMSLPQLKKLADTVLPCITTDLTQNELLSLMMKAISYMQYEMVSSRIPIDDSFYFTNICGSTIVIDFETNKEYLYKSVYEGVIE